MLEQHLAQSDRLCGGLSIEDEKGKEWNERAASAGQGL